MEVAIRSAPCVAPDMLWDDPNLKPNEFTADRRGLAVAITMPGENYQRLVHGLDLAGLYLAAVDNVETCLALVKTERPDAVFLNTASQRQNQTFAKEFHRHAQQKPCPL